MLIRHRPWILAAAVLTFHLASARAPAQSGILSETIETLRQVDAAGVGHPAAAAAVRNLDQLSGDDLLPILEAMTGANPLTRNWLRNLAEQAAASPNGFPEEDVLAFLQDRSHDPFARSLAYELLLDRDGQWRTELLPQMLEDPSRELRWAAVELLLEGATSAADKSDRLAILRRGLDASREVDQIAAIAKSLDKLGHPVDLNSHYGFLLEWQLIGPFDNTDQAGFDVRYPPEVDTDTGKSHPGKEGPVSWQRVETSSDEGIVDLNKQIGKVKGAVAYALAEFQAAEGGPAEVRLGCINANKVWWNGELIMAHEKYHQAMMIDQYQAAVTMRPGTNTVLVKVCQNEQTEPWAQDWHFQLRIATADGKAIPSTP